MSSIHVPRARLTLVAACLAVLLLPASLTGTSVAIPQINADFEPNLVALQWVVNSYNLTFACFILVCGSLADILGRKRIFVAGTILFGACSLISAFSQDILTLDFARGISGIGAAAMMTGGSALLANTYSGPSLAKAFAIFGSSAGTGLALGPSLSGFLVGIFNWRAVFVTHLVVSVVILFLAFAVKDRGAGATGVRVDWAGTFTFTPALFAFVFAVMQGPQLGWGSPVVIGLIVAIIVLGAFFVLIESRTEHPMFDLNLFRQPKFFIFCMIPVALAFGFVSLLVYLPIYFTVSYGMSVETVGIVMVLMTIPVIFVPLLSGRLLARGASARWLLTTSLLLIAVGAALLTIIGPQTPIWAIAPALLLIGTGMGLSAGILDGAAIGSVEPQRAGMAAGMFNTTRLAGETIAIAIVGTLLVSISQSTIQTRISEFMSTSAAALDPTRTANQVTSGNIDGLTDLVQADQRLDFESFLVQAFTGSLHMVLWSIVVINGTAAIATLVMMRHRSQKLIESVTVTELEVPTTENAQR